MANKKVVQRYGHNAVPLTISPKGIEVVLFGGQVTFGGSAIADTAVLRFGKLAHKSQL